MTADNGKTVTWAAFGQAIGISQGGSEVELGYDAEDARDEKTVTAASGSETVRYLGAAERIELNGQASIRRTLTLADMTIIDTGGANAGLLFPISDHLGSTIVLGDGNGQAAASMSYSPFGERMTAGWAANMSVSQALTINQTESDRGYTGQEGLDAVGLWDDNARLYDPALGRFLSVDPLIAHPESTQGINPYSYVENNPLNATDPTGMAAALAGFGACQTEGCERTIISGGVGFGGIDWNVTAQFSNGSSISGNIQQMEHSSLNQLSQVANTLAGGSLTMGADGSQTIMSANANFDVNAHTQAGGDSAGGADAMSSNGVSRDDVLPAGAAFAHFLFGDGEPIYTGADQLHLADLRPADFPNVAKVLTLARQGALGDGSINLTDKRSWQPPGLNNEATFGHITVGVKGILTVRGNEFSFTGSLHAQTDFYDFNWGLHDHRSVPGEVSTIDGWEAGKMARFGWGGGNPYPIYFVGSVPLAETGRVEQ